MTTVATEDAPIPASGSISAKRTVLSCATLAKSFGMTRALVDASFDLRAGEVHALLGENGSGKSTLVKILSGILPPSSGQVLLDAERRSTSVTHRVVATVFQEVLVVHGRSVLENVWLGTDRLFRPRLRARDKRRIAEDVLQRLCGRSVELDAPASSLSLSDQQACCIARALVREPDVLLLDEATSALDLQTRDRFFSVLDRLRADGVGIVFISHRMDEILRLADRTTVMRSGCTVATVGREDAETELFVQLMTGEGERRDAPVTQGTVDRSASAEPVVEVRNLVLHAGAKAIDLDVRAGEILGIAGLEGHGQEELLRSLWGNAPIGGGVSRIGEDGRRILLRSRASSARLGIAYVPRDRRKASIFASQSILDNFAVTTASADARFGIISERSRVRRFQEYRDSLNIRLGKPEDAVTTLSGGNQQKVVLARWLATKPAVLLLNDPTRGVDVGAKRDIYALLERLAAAGTAVVVVSSELEEQLSLMDRVVVMRENTLFTVLDRRQITRETLVSAFFGVTGSQTSGEAAR